MEDGNRVTWRNVDSRPNRAQQLLLKAALLEGQECVDALKEWGTCSSMDSLDQGSFRLLPHLYRNLEAQGIGHPLLDTWKGIYRRAWYKNQILFHKMAPVVEKLHDASIDTLLLKGAALALHYHPDPGMRPMQDIDILVPEEKGKAAIDLLKQDGWKSITWSPQVLTDSYLSFRHSIALSDEAGSSEVDLHWHATYRCSQPGHSRVFWDSALPADFMGMRTNRLCPTDELLNACVHGLKWNTIPSIRWVSDALTILRSGQPIDWNRLLWLARERHVSIPMSRALRYLESTFHAPVPQTFLEALENTPVSKGEQVYYLREVSPAAVDRPLDILRALYWQYLHSTPRRGVLYRFFRGFPRFLQYHWELEKGWLVVPRMFQWALLRLTGSSVKS